MVQRKENSGRQRSKVPSQKRLLTPLIWSAVLLTLLAAGAVWLGAKAVTIKNELNAANALVTPLKEAISTDNPQAASATLTQLKTHTSAAKQAADDPIWTLASTFPWLGANFGAVAEVARSAEDVTTLGLTPLVHVYSSLDWDRLAPSSAGTDLKPLQAAAPSVTAAAHAVRTSAARLDEIDADGLLPMVAEPLTEAREQLEGVTGALDAAATASQLIPDMLGSKEPRQYLLMIQNNAESRASGGIPGALAVLNADGGSLTLTSQSSATDLGAASPNIAVDAEQQHIYSSRLGKFMQDVNLTPDFPTAAKTAQSMWERKTGQRVAGVISIDPVALSYVLQATGPVRISSTEPSLLARTGLPAELNGKNVVKTLLSDVYAKIEQPKLQDAYFAGVAQEIFETLSQGTGDAKALLAGISHGVEEGRILIWSSASDEQALIAKYPISGSIAGPSVAPAQFGVFFNDGTGAKMDYYVQRRVQLVRQCAKDGYEQTTVRVSSTNTAPADAATALPAYVTGDGIYGVPPGSVRTNIATYGPALANIEMATIGGKRTDFAPYLHGNRPVGMVSVQLAPGETQTLEFTFSKIVQHAEPSVFVTPTAQNVEDVILPTQNSDCGPGA